MTPLAHTQDLENAMMRGGMGMGSSMMNMGMPMMASKTSGMIMKMDLCEKDNAYHMWMDMPGKPPFLFFCCADESAHMLTRTAPYVSCACMAYHSLSCTGCRKEDCNITVDESKNMMTGA
eukprot:8983-Heterococcus_DN1.PRE.7